MQQTPGGAGVIEGFDESRWAFTEKVSGHGGVDLSHVVGGKACAQSNGVAGTHHTIHHDLGEFGLVQRPLCERQAHTGVPGDTSSGQVACHHSQSDEMLPPLLGGDRGSRMLDDHQGRVTVVERILQSAGGAYLPD